MSLGPEVTFFVDLLAIYSIYLIINTSLNLEFGYAGIPNFGKVLAVGAGAFVAAAIPGRILANMAGIEGDYITENISIMSQVNTWLVDNTGVGFIVFFVTLAIAGVVGAVLGLLTAYPAIRLRGDYLAITLLAFGEGMRVIGINYTEIAGGTLGVQLPDPLVWLPQDLRFPIATVGLVAMAAVAMIYSDRLVRSPLGRLLRAVRDNEVAAESVGKDVMRARVKTIMIAAAMAGIAGAMYAFYVGGAISFAYDRLNWTFWPFMMILIGGLANSRGVLLGTLLFVLVRKLITFYKDSLQGFVPFDVVWLDYLLLGAVLLAVLLYRPQGLLSEKATPTIRVPGLPREESILSRLGGIARRLAGA